MIWFDLVGLINFGYTNAMNLVLNLTITPNILLTRPFMRFMALLCVLSTCLRTGLSIPNAKINKIWYVNQVNLDNTEKLSYKSMQMWYTYELSEMLLSYREYCTHLYIWSQLSLQASWYWIWREGRALYLYMISAESPGSMTLRSCVRDLYSTCIWSQLSLQAAWR